MKKLIALMLGIFIVLPAWAEGEGGAVTPTDPEPGEQSGETQPETTTNSIKIATTAYNNNAFSPVQTALNNAVSTIKDVVMNTIDQATAVANLQSGKQTRPDATCPAGKQCLLVEDESGTPHWYEIMDPFYYFFNSYTKDISATSLDSDKFPPTFRSAKSGDKWTYYNAFYYGDKTWRKTYIDGSTSTYDRPMDHATRCTNPSYTTDTRAASPCYSAGGMYKKLDEGEWAVVYEGGETSGPNVAVPGVLYGTSKCTSVGGPRNYATLNPTKLSELSVADQEKWNLIPNAYGTADDSTNPRANYKYCWCQTTAVGVPSTSGVAADGAIYSLPSSSAPWVFDLAYSSADDCAYICALYCANSVRPYPGFRRALLGVATN